ncbi:MarR family winged helix-turn-helix transcriptional regulator [Tropicimonas sp. IMCC6043]|uniref:MarR family winged helix-turn-helix transcriptional regulator n=1 Tax=Tropicimonas sp. IMCC6043 TaxID=2510645 RepID=UPI00101D91F0|nr:MarR family transcriptional regulator [Tropicimonas sp. IMCC6043]RYH08501.1 MarR family transcriptional regulator [Tropicimonas sp. IMCC6043]
MASSADRLGRSLSEFLRHLPVHIAPLLYSAEFGGRRLLESEVMVVMALAEDGPLSPTRISRGLNMQKGSLTAVLRRLEDLGLLGRRDIPEDERSYRVELTPAGAALATHITERRRQGLRETFARLAPDDSLAASQGLDLLSAHFRKLEEEAMTHANDTVSKPVNWYHAASPEDRKEYDAFGPWLTEVKAAADIPPRFRTFFPEHEHARFLLKVPRNADRRQLRPGMDLYEAVFAVDDDGFFLARLEDGSVTRTQVAWDDVAAVGSFSDRLQGIWTVYLKDANRLKLEFNQVSSELMDRVTDFVRAKLSPAPAVPKAALPEFPEVEFTDADIVFGSALLEIRRRTEGPLEPVHFESAGRSCVDAAGKRAVSTGVMILDSPKELVILNRGEPAHRRGVAWYATNDIFVPYGRLTHFSIIPAEAKGAGHFHTLVLRLDGQVIEQPCLELPQLVMDVLRLRCANAI